MSDAARFDQPGAMATDQERLGQLFGDGDLLPLWVAEPYVPLAPAIRDVLEHRASAGWYGYETRPDGVKGAFWEWMTSRHGWKPNGLKTIVSPSVGTSIGVLINRLTEVGDGVIIQPPVFTDFKPLIVSADRKVIRNSLVLGDDGYRMDYEGLAELAAVPSTRLMILCNPHNPVGKLWTRDEMQTVVRICEEHDVAVIADEIHADLALSPHTFVPFAAAAAGTGLRWAATHGPIKTFGLAGVCDTLLITDNAEVAGGFKTVSNQLHLTRNNVFAIAAFEAAYREGAGWLDDLLQLVAGNLKRLQEGLSGGVRVMPHEATYLAWLDFRELGIEVPELAGWLASRGVALSPGHWFGRPGAGFARMSIAVAPGMIDEAIERLNRGATA